MGRVFFFNDTAPTEIYTLSLHDALPISVLVRLGLGAQVDPEDLQEFTQLAVSAGALPVATLTGRRERPDSRYFLGSGKAEELRGIARAQQADVIQIGRAHV